jgi:hypothetical protein
MSLAHIQDVNLESGVPTVPSSQNDAPNKYIFPAFANFDGERRLETILRAIIKLSEWRTWQAAVSFQAPGMPCYVSLEKIAERSQRCLRQIQMDIASLQQRGLLVIRPGWIEVELADGTYAPRAVLVKDFTPLYRLADEYLRWIQCPAYIPADRQYAEIIKQNEELARHLEKFNDYRRILKTAQPGRKSATDNGHEMHEESYEWITKYISNTFSKTSSQYRKEANGQDYKDQETNSSSGRAAGTKKEEFGTRPRTIRSRANTIETETGTQGTNEPENREAKPEHRNSVPVGERPGAAAPASEAQGKGKRRGQGQGAKTSGEELPPLPTWIHDKMLGFFEQYNERHPQSAVTRMRKLWKRAQCLRVDEYTFTDWLDYPKQEVDDRMAGLKGGIKRFNKDGTPAGMPLFFDLLEERVELEETQWAAYEEERQRLEAQQREWEQESQAPESQKDEDQAQLPQDETAVSEESAEESQAETPNYIQRVEQIVLDAGESEHLEISINLAVAVYSFCLSYYEAFTETMYLAFIASASEQVGERYSAQQFFEVLLRSLELEVVSDENGAFEVYPVGIAGSDPGRDEGEQS